MATHSSILAWTIPWTVNAYFTGLDLKHRLSFYCVVHSENAYQLILKGNSPLED